MKLASVLLPLLSKHLISFTNNKTHIMATSSSSKSTLDTMPSYLASPSYLTLALLGAHCSLHAACHFGIGNDEQA
jgi:hypothetical protein